MSLKEKTKPYLDREQLPKVQGVYLAKGIWGDWRESLPIEVYEHPIKGLCCFSEEFGSAGTGADEEHDCHVSVQCTGLEFISRIGDLP